jgi:hypothetical protein
MMKNRLSTYYHLSIHGPITRITVSQETVNDNLLNATQPEVGRNSNVPNNPSVRQRRKPRRAHVTPGTGSTAQHLSVVSRRRRVTALPIPVEAVPLQDRESDWDEHDGERLDLEKVDAVGNMLAKRRYVRKLPKPRVPGSRTSARTTRPPKRYGLNSS